jgi:1-deoxy-D-xylulose-5-phosphate reductoisomerase
MSPSSATEGRSSEGGLTPDRAPRVGRLTEEARPLGVALLGSTGSIGRQAIDVIERHPDRLRIVALAAGTDARTLEEQARRLHPAVVALAAKDPLDLPEGTTRLDDPDALVTLATRDDVDLVVVATGGVVSLRPVLAALEAGKVVATANKETLVAGGHLVMPLARQRAEEWTRAAAAGRTGTTANLVGSSFASPLAWLRPIDSEHCAIWQCLAGEAMSAVARLILTASGGPFLDSTPAELAAVTVEQALRHPTWRMGAKITIDSATLANKGLEVIEAHWLYDVGYDAIDVVVHPQSVVHSAVVFVDGSLKAQMGTPDMRLPIQYALLYPHREPSPAAAPDLAAAATLTFRSPDADRFPALRIARDAGRVGSRATAVLIAADEVAVARFLDGTLDFPGIPRLLEDAVTRFGEGRDQAPDLEALTALDLEVRDTFAGPSARRVGRAAAAPGPAA